MLLDVHPGEPGILPRTGCAVFQSSYQGRSNVGPISQAFTSVNASSCSVIMQHITTSPALKVKGTF